MSRLAVVLVVGFLVAVSASSASKKDRTLVLVDNLSIQSTHSIFFDSLKAHGHELTFREASDDTYTFEKFGVYYYDHLILFAPTAEELGVLSVQSILGFIDAGHNVLLAVNENVTEPLRELAYEVGLSLDDERTCVIDHINFDASDSGSHTLIAATNIIDAPVIVGSKELSPILFKGIGHATVEGSRLFTKVLTGSDSTYSYIPNTRVDEYPASTGHHTLLVTAVQTRNNARIVVSGSLELFSDKFFTSSVTVGVDSYPQSGNLDFATHLAAWNFGERGILRATHIQHQHRDGGDINPKAYRVSDYVNYSITIEEYDGASDQWIPYQSQDVQLEVIMLDPYIRTTLLNNHGKFTTSLQVPDVYGVYKFVIDHHRIGYSNLQITQQVSVHPFRHHQFERFIDVAYPYYLSAFSMMIGFFIFGIVFLYHKE